MRTSPRSAAQDIWAGSKGRIEQRPHRSPAKEFTPIPKDHRIEYLVIMSHWDEP